MTSVPELERGYRRLVACYPRSFRSQNAEEIVAVLLSTAHPGQRRPGIAESFDLLRGAARMRMGLTRAPHSVVTAVRLMCLGALAETLTLIVALVTRGSIRAAAIREYPQYASQVAQVVNHDVALDIVALPTLAATWLLVAWGNGRGNQWARLAAITFAVMYTLVLGTEVAQGAAIVAPAALVTSGVAWALGVVAVVFILQPRSWPYYERHMSTVLQAPDAGSTTRTKRRQHYEHQLPAAPRAPAAGSTTSTCCWQ